MREAHGAGDTETAAAVATSRDTVVAVDADMRIAAGSRKRTVVVAVVCSRGPRH